MGCSYSGAGRYCNGAGLKIIAVVIAVTMQGPMMALCKRARAASVAEIKDTGETPSGIGVIDGRDDATGGMRWRA